MMQVIEESRMPLPEPVGADFKSGSLYSAAQMCDYAKACYDKWSSPATPTRTQGAMSDRTLAFIDLLNHYDSTMRNVMALPSGRTQEQKDRARLALIKAFETRAAPADHISQARDEAIEECAKVCDNILEKGEYSGQDIDCYQETADRCAKKIRAMKSAPDAWISVGERLPEPGDAVLIAFADGGVDLSFRYVMKKTGAHVCWEGVEFEHHESPTHWQPLPAPPEKPAGDVSDI